MDKACYRKLKRYKYQLMDEYSIQIDIKPVKILSSSFYLYLPREY